MTYRGLDTYHRLRGTVCMLAADAAVQIAFLNKATARAKYEVQADDITTEFRCWVQHSEELATDGLLTRQSVEVLVALSRQVAVIDSSQGQWTAVALAESPKWVHVRDRARIALALMDEHQAPPSASL